MIDEWKKGAKYWDHAWNPVIGCRKVSEGCANCYAAHMAERFPVLRDHDGGFMPHRNIGLKKPPEKGIVFVGNMTDLFGEWNDGLEIRRWISALSPTATNLVLTKRAGRLRDFAYTDMMRMEHVFYGVTAETQSRLEFRASQLFKTGAFWRWISCEPLLEEIDLTVLDCDNDRIIDGLDWVVVGAESGPNRRPCKLEWVRQIVWQCGKAGVPVFVKQLDIDGKLVKDIAKFPEDLQIRQVPWTRGEE